MDMYSFHPKHMVDSQAAFAAVRRFDKPAPTLDRVKRQIETKKKLAINAIPTAHTTERSIAQSAT